MREGRSDFCRSSRLPVPSSSSAQRPQRHGGSPKLAARGPSGSSSPIGRAARRAPRASRRRMGGSPLAVACVVDEGDSGLWRKLGERLPSAARGPRGRGLDRPSGVGVTSTSIRRRPSLPSCASSPPSGLVRCADRSRTPRRTPRLEDERLGIVEHAEPGSTRRSERAEQPPLQAVDRRYPGSVELSARSGRPLARREPPDACLSLLAALHVRDHEHRVDVSPSSTTARTNRSTGTAVLPSPRAGRDEHRSASSIAARCSFGAGLLKGVPVAQRRGGRNWGQVPPSGRDGHRGADPLDEGTGRRRAADRHCVSNSSDSR